MGGKLKGTGFTRDQRFEQRHLNNNMLGGHVNQRRFPLPAGFGPPAPEPMLLGPPEIEEEKMRNPN